MIQKTLVAIDLGTARSNDTKLPPGQSRSNNRRLSLDKRWWRFGARLGGLTGLGLISALLYVYGITAPYPLGGGLQVPRTGWYVLSGRSLRAGLVFAVVIGLLILCYVAAVRLTLRRGDRHARAFQLIIVAGWLVSSAALLGAYPGESFDIFDYLFRGRMIVEFGASPLAIAPSVYKNQPFYNYITWRAFAPFQRYPGERAQCARTGAAAAVRPGRDAALAGCTAAAGDRQATDRHVAI